MLTNRLSILKDIENTIKIGHHEDLLARIDNLGEVKKHLPKLQETIKIATGMSAYGPVAAIFARLHAYHGDDFDLHRLLLPLQMDTQDYARIRNAVEPLAAEAAQKYGLNYGHC
jgi:lipase chaperone LimK